MSLPRNITANYLGKAWMLLINFVVVPLYIRYLGVTGYGVIAAYTVLITAATAIDFGFANTLNRVIAQNSVANDGGISIRNTLRAFEAIYWLLGTAIGLAIVLGASLYSALWAGHGGVMLKTLCRNAWLMGLSLLFQWPCTLYSGGLMGCQKHTLLNGIKAACATLQAGGGLLIIKYVSCTLEAWFLWQAACCGLQAFMLAWTLRAEIGGKSSGRVQWRLSLTQWQYSVGTMAIAVVAMLLLHADKAVLSFTSSPEAYGEYMVAASVVMAQSALSFPIYSAVLPRLTQVIEDNDERTLVKVYYGAGFLLGALSITVAVHLSVYSHELMSIWLKNPHLVDAVAPIVSVLSLAACLNGIMLMPFALQMAAGWTSLSFWKNVASVVCYIPILVTGVRWCGVLGAAGSLLLLNASYLMYEPIIVHRRMLKGGARAWYCLCVLGPLAVSYSVASMLRHCFPGEYSLVGCCMGTGFTWAVFFWMWCRYRGQLARWAP